MAIAALVLGIIGILFSWFPAVIVGVPLALIGLILSIVARKNAMATQQPTGMATAGLVVSIIGIVFAALSTAACVACFHKLDKKASDPAFQEQLRRQREEFDKAQDQNNKEFNDAFKSAVDRTQKPGLNGAPATTVPAPTPTPGAMPAPIGGAPPPLPAPAPPPNLPAK